MSLKHFKIYELVDRVTWYMEKEDAWNHFTPVSLTGLDNLRDFFNVPLTVNTWWWNPNGFQYRGYRPPSYAAGAQYSQHRIGNAFDFDVKGMNAQDARNKIIENKDDPLLEGITRMEIGVNWVHIDFMRLNIGMNRIVTFTA